VADSDAEPTHLDLDAGRHVAHAWSAAAPGPSVLALHGFTGSGADWGPVAPVLSTRVIAPDLLGHGGSPAPAEAEAYQMERVVDHALAWCGSAPSWIVLGYSMGGRVALRLASRLGARLQAMVIVSASPGIEDAAEREARAERDRELADAIEAHGTAWFVDRWARHPLIRSQQQIPSAIRRGMEARRLANRPRGLAGSLRGMGQGVVTPVWDDLGSLQAPTLWITGDGDPTYTAIGARAVGLLPRGRHVRIPDAGHCTHLEALDPVAQAIDDFLAEVAPPGRRG
jgi:2-succinyl-6-hydroxy-2,4-cyclohexadiene-1-carboxylate synthase